MILMQKHRSRLRRRWQVRGARLMTEFHRSRRSAGGQIDWMMLNDERKRWRWWLKKEKILLIFF